MAPYKAPGKVSHDLLYYCILKQPLHYFLHLKFLHIHQNLTSDVYVHNRYYAPDHLLFTFLFISCKIPVLHRHLQLHVHLAFPSLECSGHLEPTEVFHVLMTHHMNMRNLFYIKYNQACIQNTHFLHA